jgi:Ca-activated chloride channel family protein
MAHRLRTALTLLALLLCAPLLAQQPTFRADVAGVNLDVAVTRGGRPVRGLAAADFVLTDSGAAQRVDSASLETLPLSVFLVLDVSGSVAGEKLRYLTEASRSLLSALRPGDRVSLVTFADRVLVRVPLTADANAARLALDGLTAAGPTSLRDATYAALQLAPDDRTRPVILVFSDGRDTASWLSQADVLGAVRRSGVVMHAVELIEDEVVSRPAGRGTRPPQGGIGALRAQPSSPFLGELVAASGGRRWAATSAARLTDLFADALNEMRSRYLLTYYPTNGERAGWHPLTIRLARGRADVTHRPGYQVPAKP